MRFSKTEIRHLTKAWLLLSFAFGIVLSGGVKGLLAFDAKFFGAVIFSAIGVGTAFVFHELMHKYFAQKYGCWAEFRANDLMLGLAVLMSFFGFIFAAPGGVFIRGHLSVSKYGKVSLAGPMTNVATGFLFLALALANIHPITTVLGTFGMTINFWLALFNMIPVLPLDGAKVLAWNKPVYFAAAALCVFLVFGLPMIV